jgi:GDP-L-fucose synthase
MLHNGPPHESNDAYAYSKRMLEIHSKSYQQQYGDNFICVIPTNIYGEHDNFSLEEGHVIPALIHKCYNAKHNKEKFVVCGSGKPLRQFIYSIDLARLIMWALLEYEEKESIILSVGENDEVSIKDVGLEIAKQFNYEYMVEFDESYSDGQFKKTADNSKLMELINKFPFTRIEDGIKRTIEWFEREAFEMEAEAQVDGVKVLIYMRNYRRNHCYYDFVLITPRQRDPQTYQAFRELLSGVRFK